MMSKASADDSKVAVEGLIQKATSQTQSQGKNKKFLPHWHPRHHRHHWHHRHHRHHWHHRHIFEVIADAVEDAWNSVTDWWANAAPGLIFRVENNEFELNIC